MCSSKCANSENFVENISAWNSMTFNATMSLNVHLMGATILLYQDGVSPKSGSIKEEEDAIDLHYDTALLKHKLVVSAEL